MLLAAASCAPVALGADPSSAVARLANYGLTPTTQSLSGYFASLHSSAERAKMLRELIAQLADEDFTRREGAMKQLTRQVGGLGPLLTEAIAGDNAEIRWRAKVVLDSTDVESKALLSAAFSAINEQKVPGLAPSLFAVQPLAVDKHQQVLLRRALVATASVSDVPFLRKQLKASDPQARLAALTALSSVIGERSTTDALPLLADASETVQLAAARVLASHGCRESLPALVGLLDSPTSDIRSQASRLLVAATGKEITFRTFAPESQRTAAIAEWKAWLAGEGATETILHPLQETPAELGRLLVCDHGRNMLIEYDAAGKVIWEKAVGQQPWACLGLASGHRLVASYNEKTIVEYDDQGKEIWRSEVLPGGPTSIDRLENGNTLVACTEGAEVVEIGPDKKVVWRVALEGRPVDARRLSDGRTLITLQNASRVIEVDESGKEVWQLAGLGQPFSAQRLDSGNTLVAAIGHDKVREFDRSGRVVWEHGTFQTAYSAQRTESGHTIVVDQSGVSELDPEGKVITKKELPNVSRAWRY
jgi:HEAT repeat protein